MEYSKLSLGLIVSANGCLFVCPAIGWKPVQGVLLPEDVWNSLQRVHNPHKNKRIK